MRISIFPVLVICVSFFFFFLRNVYSNSLTILSLGSLSCKNSLHNLDTRLIRYIIYKYLLPGMEILIPFWKNWHYLLKLSIHIVFGPSNPHLRTYAIEIRTYFPPDTSECS